MAAITFPHSAIKRGQSISMECGAAMTALGSSGGGGYSLVKIGAAAGLCIQSSAADAQDVIGFLQEDGDTPAAGDQVTVYLDGIVWAIAAGTITYAQMCESATNGRVQAAAATDACVGICLQFGGAAVGDRFPLLIRYQIMA